MLPSLSLAAALLGCLVPKPQVWGWAECTTKGRLQVRAGRLISEGVVQQQRDHRLSGHRVSTRRSAAQQYHPLPGHLTEILSSFAQHPHCQVPIIRYLWGIQMRALVKPIISCRVCRNAVLKI